MQGFRFLFLIIVAAHSLQAQDNPRWLRYCAISPDAKTIAFMHKGNLYRVPASGGKAMRLTHDGSYHFMPVWSHDGKYIAYAGNRYGNFDIFIMPAQGGEAKRLTWHSTDEYPYDFSNHDSAVLFGAVRMDAPGNRQFPSEAMPELYSVPAAGGQVKQALTVPAENARISADGRYIIYHDRKGRENPWRKHQRSSIARDIWLYDKSTGHHTRISAFDGEDRNPVFTDDASNIYYLSEESGSFNIHELSLSDPSSSKQISFFKKHPVRFLSIGRNNTLCFGYDGAIYVKKKNASARQLRISIPEEPEEMEPKTVPIGEIKEMAVSPSGKELAFIFRGEVFACSIAGHNVKRITSTAGEEAGISFSPDGKYLLYAGERDSSWKIYQTEIISKNEPFFFSATELKETTLIANGGENDQPKYSPDGKEIAFIENRTTLKIYNIASRQSRTILTGEQLYSRRDHDQYFEWSPDGRWLLLQYDEQGGGNDEVGIVSSTGKGRLINLTQSGYNDSRPRWMMDGRMICWLSDRNGLHGYANGSSRQNDVYALFPDRNDWNNFRLDKPEDTLQREPDGKGIARSSSPVDWTALGSHKERLSPQAANLADALVSRNGEALYYLVKFEKGYDLWMTSLHSKESKMILPLHADEAMMQWDKEQKYIFLLADGRILKVDPLQARQDLVNTAGQMSIDPAVERRSMFEHVWRRTKETFYTAGMHGADWDDYKKAFQKYLPGINNNYDFAEMLNELLGELNVSHTGVTYRNPRKDKDVTASLGVFYDQTYTDTGMQIESVIPDGPLDDPALNIKPGTIIEAVDGEPVRPDKDFAQYLNRKAGKNTVLNIRNGNSRTAVTVKPVSPEEESDLLYKRWVKRNEAETDSLSHGELGYVHLYRMNDAAYRNVYEYALGKYAGRKGLVIDTRFNRGGDLASELGMFLSGSQLRSNTTDHFLVSIEPSFRWTKPSIVLANEANYSDGHCFVYDYQTLHLGKLVGMPVPGSCTFQTGQSLPDNTLQWSAPTLGVKNLQGQYLENRQTEPDLRVMNEFDKVSTGLDQQLEAATGELLKEIKAQ